MYVDIAHALSSSDHTVSPDRPPDVELAMFSRALASQDQAAVPRRSDTPHRAPCTAPGPFAQFCPAQTCGDFKLDC
jgi:hypothetical protein